MKDNPLVSIVIPVHNAQEYLRESLDSCLRQTYKNLEIYVVDDKSTDSSLSIANEYKERNSNVFVIALEKQNGLGNVINHGIRESKGKYIARMDADDIMSLTRIEQQVKLLENNQNVVAVGGQIDIINKDSNITGHREYAISDKQLKKNIFLFSPFAHPAVMLRRDVVEKVGLYPEDLWKVEDIKLFFLLSKEGEFANLDTTVLKYRVTFNTESQSNMVEHFKKTNEVRKWAIEELNIKPTIREYILWKLECVGVYLLNFLPKRIFFKVYEIARKVLK